MLVLEVSDKSRTNIFGSPFGIMMSKGSDFRGEDGEFMMMIGSQ
jgi:hypothetical protein